jgi:hypothetical protein
MKHPCPLLFLLTCLFFTNLPATAQEWAFQGSVGVVENLETSLEIRQSGFETIEVDADYETRPFEGPPYYSLRAGRWAGRRGWELELIHQKLFLRNRPPEIEQFSISHGYNFVLVNRGWEIRRVLLRAGAGAIVAHPENRVRGRSLDDSEGGLGGGYYLTGPALQVGLEGRIGLGAGAFLGIEGKVTAARAQVPVAGGEADVPNVAAHALLSLGWLTGERQ